MGLCAVQEIANHMEKDTETYEVVQEAIDTMQRVAWHINDMKRKHEHAVRLQVRQHTQRFTCPSEWAGRHQEEIRLVSILQSGCFSKNHGKMAESISLVSCFNIRI